MNKSFSINIVKDTISGIKGIFGGKSTTYSNEYSSGRKLALLELESQAHVVYLQTR